MGRTGYVSTINTNNRKAIHTDRDCIRLKDARKVGDVDLEEDEPYCNYTDDDSDWHICGFCSGSYEPGTSDNGLRNKLADPDFGPEDIGLSPTGERAND